MEKHFMIDIETTGIEPDKNDLLQVGILECTFDGQRWNPGRSIELINHTDKQPESQFAKEHMTDLYQLCNAAPKWEPLGMRTHILEFFKRCGETPPMVYLMGWNASNFDIPFLVHKGILKPNYYEIGPDGKDIMRGDFHYRVYEMGGAVSLAQNVKNYSDRKTLLQDAENVYGEYPALPQGKQHDALFDCYKQLRILNGLIRMLK